MDTQHHPKGQHEWVIRLARPEDVPEIWAILKPIIRAGETFAMDREITQHDAIAYWNDIDHETFVLEDDGEILGTYYLRPNQPGGGSHVANCAYATSELARGKGIARTMCLHSIDLAQSMGFKAMQFNFVVSTNQVAVRLWTSLGFDIVGVLPEAFSHPEIGDVDALVMYRKL